MDATFPSQIPQRFPELMSQLPSLIVRAGDDAIRRFIEFFAVTIRSRNTRAAYAQATVQFFGWCER